MQITTELTDNYMNVKVKIDGLVYYTSYSVNGPDGPICMTTPASQQMSSDRHSPSAIAEIRDLEEVMRTMLFKRHVASLFSRG